MNHVRRGATRRRRRLSEPAVRRVISAVMMAFGLGGALAVIPVVLLTMSQMDTYFGQSASSQERLVVIFLIALVFLFLAVMAAVLFTGGFVVSSIDFHADEQRRDRLTRKEIWQAILVGRGPAYLVGFDLAAFDLSLVRWLRGANLSGANLTQANLEGSDLDGAQLERAEMAGAVLTTTSLREANLDGANLTGADLSNADLSGASLKRARLVGANLTGAHLEGADLEGANLDGATLDEAVLEGARLEGATLPSALRHRP